MKVVSFYSQMGQSYTACLTLELVFQWWRALYSILNVSMEACEATQFQTAATRQWEGLLIFISWWNRQVSGGVSACQRQEGMSPILNNLCWICYLHSLLTCPLLCTLYRFVPAVELTEGLGKIFSLIPLKSPDLEPTPTIASSTLCYCGGKG